MTPFRLTRAASLALVYAVCYSVIKASLPYAPPLLLGGIRAGVGGLLLLAYLALRGRPLIPSRALWFAVVVLALVGSGAGFSAMFLSPGLAGAGISSLLGNTGPLLLIVLSALYLDEAITASRIQALLLGMIGVGLIAYPSLGTGSMGIIAILLPLGAAASAAISTVLLKRMHGWGELLQISAWQLILGSILLIELSAQFESGASMIWSPALIASLGFLALFGTAFALVAWYWLVQREQVGRLGLLMFAVPVLGLLVGSIAFGEALGGWEIAGTAVIMLAIARALFADQKVGRSSSSLLEPAVVRSL